MRETRAIPRQAAWAWIALVACCLSPAPAAAGNGISAPAASAGAGGNPGLWWRLRHVGENVVGRSPAAQVLMIVAGTLISEDLVCISVGTLIHHHQISWALGGWSCFLGIYIGDLLFFFLGRLAGARLLRFRFFSRALGERRLREFGEWFDRRPWAAIMACRFLPGIRVPLYVSVGALTKRTGAFFGWTCFFACVWTPALIGLVVLLGGAFTRPFEYVFGKGWWTIPLTIAAIYALVRTAILLSTAEGRQTLKGRAARLFARGAQSPPAAGQAPDSYTRSG